MTFSKLPTWFILYYIAYSMSPIIAIFGFSRLIGPFYNICCQKKYKYKPYTVSATEPFKLIIPLIERRYSLANRVLRILMRKLRKETDMKQNRNIFHNIM